MANTVLAGAATKLSQLGRQVTARIDEHSQRRVGVVRQNSDPILKQQLNPGLKCGVFAGNWRVRIAEPSRRRQPVAESDVLDRRLERSMRTDN
jgi:hypothetical protein